MSVLKKRNAAEADLPSDGSPSKAAKTASPDTGDADATVTGTFVPVYQVVLEIATIQIERSEPYVSSVTIKTFSTEREAHMAVLSAICTQMREQIPDAINGWDDGASDEEEDDGASDEEEDGGASDEEEDDEVEDQDGEVDESWKLDFHETLQRERPSHAYQILMHDLSVMRCDGITWDGIECFLVRLRKLLCFIQDVCLDGASGNWPDYGVVDIVAHQTFYKPVESAR